MKWTIYAAIFPNNKKYIGQTRRTLKQRINNHKSKHKRYNSYFYKACNKYGFENIKWIILEVVFSAKDAYSTETEWISYYKTCDRRFGYNSTTGGESCFEMTDETKQKMKWSEDKRAKMIPKLKKQACDPERNRRYSELNSEIWSDEKRKYHSDITQNKVKVSDNLGNKFESLTDLSKFYRIDIKIASQIMRIKSVFCKKYALRIWKTEESPKETMILHCNGIYHINAIKASIQLGISDKQVLNIANGKIYNPQYDITWVRITITDNDDIKNLIFKSLRR